MGIADFGSGTNQKIVSGEITYPSSEDGGSGLGRCSTCKNHTCHIFLGKNKKEQEEIENLSEDEVFCLSHRKAVGKWYDCNRYSKQSKNVKGYFYGWNYQNGISESFKDLVDPKSITKSAYCYDINEEECFLGDIVKNEYGLGVFVFDFSTKKIELIPLIFYSKYKEKLNIEGIQRFKVGKALFEIVSSIYELEYIEKKTILQFLEENIGGVKLTKEGNLPKKRGRKKKVIE